MKSHPDFDEVTAGLGDKVLDGFAQAVKGARQDLADYRSIKPGWVADASDRGLANWIHDRLWAHLAVILDSVEGVHLHESGPTREVVADAGYRLRVKRHHLDGAVRSYPTTSALQFFEEPVVQLTLDGLGEVRLAIGYEWDRDGLNQMGRAVLSLRQGEEIIWLEELPETGTEYVVPIQEPGDGGGPPAPTVGVGENDLESEENPEGS